MAKVVAYMYVNDQSVMREHLIKCLEGSEMQPFPVMRERRIGAASSFIIDVYCYCRCPEDGTQMVQCDSKTCKDWFHVNCIDTPVKTGKNGTARIVRNLCS